MIEMVNGYIFCRVRGGEKVHLWPFGGLDAARRPCERAGFRLAMQQRGARWGIEVDGQRFELPVPIAT